MPAQDKNIYTLQIGDTGKMIKVETAVTPRAVRQGLSFRKSLAKGTGMFFVFSTLDYHTMWMPDMNFSLDVVWLDENLEVVHISYGLQPCVSRQVCPAAGSEKMAKYAIEVNEGDADALRFKIGTKLTVV
jgi:uncharacterized membrane protein (UPF0127 family)